MKKQIIIIFLLALLVFSCSKDNKKQEFATDDIVPAGWTTVKQSLIIEGKQYNLTVASDPNGSGIKFLNSPFEVEQFFEDNNETLVSHVVIDEKETKVYYYMNVASFNKNVAFICNEQTPTKSYNGATVTVWENVTGFPYYASGNAIQDKSNVWKGFWNLPSSPLNGVQAYGKSRNYVGSTLNDEISAVSFYMNNADEPITFVAYLHTWTAGTIPYATNDPVNCVVLTKLPAAFGNDGTWVGSNTAALSPIRRNVFKSWNDCISGYEFWQNATLDLANVYVR